jgi:radical SAM protein with 4Fe4S-binding SPASM domain
MLNNHMVFPLSPIAYSLELTYACKHKCPGCANKWNNDHARHMVFWKRILNCISPPDHRHQYAEIIRVTGGEPTLHHQFTEIIQYIDQLNIPHALFTSGRWAYPRHVIDCYQSCNNFTGMLISLHGHTKNSHQQFVQANESHIFSEVCNTIEQVAKSGLTVFTNTVLTRFNCAHVDEIIQLSKDLGAECAVFNRFIGECPEIQPSVKQLKHALEQIKAYDRSTCHLGNCIPQCFESDLSDPPCAGFEHCAISPEGWIRPDNLTAQVFGNIFEASIEDIWQSERARAYRLVCHPDCLQCAELMNCRGGERSEIIEYGLKQDRLMTSRFKSPIKQCITLDPAWHPLPLFRIRKHTDGLILTRYNLSLPVDNRMRPILDAMNGQNTIHALQQNFGDNVIDVIGILAQKGFLTFE